MPATHTRLVDVRAAVRPGRDGSRGEDQVFTTPNAVIVLDGASQPDPAEHDGGWLADTLGRELSERLADRPDAGLATMLAESIRTVASRYRLEPRSAPSTTVSLVRWSREAVDVLVLGDSPVIAMTTDGHIVTIRDDRLTQVAGAERNALRAAVSAPDHDLRLRLADVERQARNTTDGYWIAEAEPEAAHHAKTTRLKTPDLAAILVVTDGVSAGVDRYGVPPDWPSAFTIAQRHPAELVDAIHAAEATDPDQRRWPRSKQHDDKAAALVRFAPAAG